MMKSTPSQAVQSTFSIEELARLPLPGMAIPTSFSFNPDGQSITFLYSSEGTLRQQLYSFNPETGERALLIDLSGLDITEENITREEALRRERQRQRAVGITHYAWAGRNGRLLIPLRGNLYVRDAGLKDLRLLVAGQGRPAIDPQFSPDGEWVAYVYDSEVHVVPFTGGSPLALTGGASESGRTHGLAEFIAQEEMDRSRGSWWSPDSRSIAFEEVDESHIPVYRIMHQGQDEVGENAQEDHRYPFAGAENARVRLGVVSLGGGDPVWMDLGTDEDIYLARVQWLPDGRLTAQIENRAQNELRLVIFDPTTGQPTTLLTETNPVWINLNNLFRPLKGSGGFLWGSERSGFQHLYRYDTEGRLLNAVTAGDWMVDSIAGIDEERGKVYFTATLESPLERHLYEVGLEGGQPKRLTPARGMHDVSLDIPTRRFIDTYSTTDHPPVVRLRSLDDGAEICDIFTQDDPRVRALGLFPPELVEIQNRNGDLLHGAIYHPPAGAGSGPYPTIVYVYGGPHVQNVTRSWIMTVNMRAQYLRGLGFLVFVLDNRGSARRGLVFEGAIRHDMGHLEVEDQVDGVRWLVARGLADPERVGIYGWSYGGYMSAMCLARAPETFKAAVAGAPVTNMDGYDTHYTERYMSTPQDNPQGYHDSSVMTHIPNLRGRLLIVHGLIDENVHFRHTARLISALISARKPYDLILFPDERHMPRREADRIYMEERIRDFFLDALGKQPPS